jgi:hypothetical protein
MPRKGIAGLWPLAALLQLALAIVLFEHAAAPPSPLPADAAADRFSALRALRHVEVIAAEPHPVGSAANARVRDYLVGELQALGLQVEVQRQLQVNRYGRRADARFAMVENVVAVRPGREPGPALVLMSHYDSVAAAPGAGDAASGVAAILETLRALGDAPLRNRLVVLLSDGEEAGLLGAQAFFGSHPLAAELGLVLNFEARGSRGPVAMFETSDGNAALIAAFATAVPAPLANSLIYSLYRQMPNDTDLSIARAAGHAGMNFAFVDGLFDYHHATDTPSHLSAASVQDLGEQMLALVRHHGERPLPLPVAGDARYFNPFGRGFVHYPGWVDGLGWLLATTLLALALLRSRRADGLRAVALPRAVAAAAALVAVPLAVVWLLGQGGDGDATLAMLARGRGGLLVGAGLAAGLLLLLVAVRSRGLAGWQALAIAALLAAAAAATGAAPAMIAALAVCGLLLLALRRPMPALELVSGALLLAWLLATALLLALPAGAWLLVWPLLAVAAMHALRPAPTAAWLLAVLPAMLLLGAMAATFDVMVGHLLAAAALLPLLLALLLALPLLARPGAGAVGLGLVLAALALQVAFAVAAPWSVRHPRPTELWLLHDHDRDQTLWLSSDRELTDWHRQRLGATPQTIGLDRVLPGSNAQARAAPAAPLAAPLPRLELRRDRIDADGRRVLQLWLAVDGGADALQLQVPASARLQGWAIDRQPLQLPPAGRAIRLRGFALPPGGVELDLELDPDSPLPTLTLASLRTPLPASHTLPARGQTQMRRAGWSDSLVSLRRIDLATLAPSAPTENPPE